MSREAEEEQSTLRFQAQFDSAKTAKKLQRGETSKGRGLFQQPAKPSPALTSRAPSAHAAVKQFLIGLQPACARCVMSGWIMNTNHKWLLATVFFWAIGAYFLAAGLVNPAARMDPPFENDR